MQTQILDEFQKHTDRLRGRARERRDAVRMRASVIDPGEREEANEDDLLGKWTPSDEYQGDVVLRTLRALLAKIDERGFERCGFALTSLHTHRDTEHPLTCPQVCSSTPISLRV